MAGAAWVVSDELWKRIEPLLPKIERRFRYPGRKRLPIGRRCRGSCSCSTPGSRGGASGQARLRRGLTLSPADG
jgi:transposase